VWCSSMRLEMSTSCSCHSVSSCQLPRSTRWIVAPYRQSHRHTTQYYNNDAAEQQILVGECYRTSFSLRGLIKNTRPGRPKPCCWTPLDLPPVRSCVEMNTLQCGKESKRKLYGVAYLRSAANSFLRKRKVQRQTTALRIEELKQKEFAETETHLREKTSRR
jgi:hypothetical protein